MTVDNGIWVLGYGSLIYKPPPHYTHRVPAIIHGYLRRFWQASTDHRGVPGDPGRVVTLLPYDEVMSNVEFLNDCQFYDNKINDRDDLITLGCVYYIPEKYADEVKENLDVREQGGYTLHEVQVHLEVSPEQESELEESLKSLPVHVSTGRRILTTSVYIGTVTNSSFVGPEDLDDTAKIIAKSVGPSGTNYEYIKLLHNSLENMPLTDEFKIHDRYLETLLKQVEKIRAENVKKL
ncbi:hypothetical protein KAFR_0B02480 [Kazachstania africana CBS 2517]|uniref:glutathione-specific gamma-glutamylcyclotransferase n=1 Tax=Kazachstania africana (strain ATCC 22294 / BCRC 22015 / CBS 2517 / CECT 1963 / NBRC 1671 / NRRL Y-8276) TaxID=1071382 RepID=H2AQ96_KAZAF|nr:hypothetical protein KAFR_0B02480 [Kazachstania africana CBS 2517]CCF56546.1 hypothetical protein KAFR_0B02480 [Kazachstania africana CBS 2517]